MKSTWLFRKVLLDKEAFTWEAMQKLSTRELRFVARIMQAPHSLPRKQLIARILVTFEVRGDLAETAARSGALGLEGPSKGGGR